jgi:hypothetical protein
MADATSTQSTTAYPFDDPLKLLGGRTRYFKRQLGDRAAEAQQLANETVANTVADLRNRGFNTRNIGGVGAVGAGVSSAINQFQQDQPLGAAAAIPGSMIGGSVTGAVTNFLTKGMPGPLGKIARVVVPVLGAYGGGEVFARGAENIKNAVTGQQTGNKPETKGTETPLFGPNNIPLNEAARRYAYETQLMDREFGYSKQMLGAEIAAQKDLMQHQFQQQLQYSKSLDPLVQSGLDKHLVRSQALLNTQGNIDARLGILATQGALAKGAQAEAGALARTMAGTNPYVQAAVRQSPNIQFG